MLSHDFVIAISYVASALVFTAFFMRSRARLRQVGIASNLTFITYGVLGHVWPLLILHSSLLPLNIIRLRELMQTKKAIKTALEGDMRPDWLEPFADRVTLTEGQQLFAQGDPGDLVYFVLSGGLQLTESGTPIGPGSLLGEIAIISRQGKRTQTAVAAAPTVLLAMSQEEMLTLCRRQPDFAVYLLRLVASRLVDNGVRLREMAATRTA